MMSDVVEKRLGELLGAGFKVQLVEQVLRTTSGLLEKKDFSERDLFWIYEYLLNERDGDDTRRMVAGHLNGLYQRQETRGSAVSAVRILSEGNPMYRPSIDGDKILPFLDRPLQEIVVQQEVWKMERGRNAGDDTFLSPEHLERMVNDSIQQRLGCKRTTGNQ